MKYINKYIKMFENEVLEKPVVKEQTKTATEKDVVDRLERIYKDLLLQGRCIGISQSLLHKTAVEIIEENSI